MKNAVHERHCNRVHFLGLDTGNSPRSLAAVFKYKLLIVVPLATNKPWPMAYTGPLQKESLFPATVHINGVPGGLRRNEKFLRNRLLRLPGTERVELQQNCKQYYCADSPCAGARIVKRRQPYFRCTCGLTRGCTVLIRPRQNKAYAHRPPRYIPPPPLSATATLLSKVVSPSTLKVESLSEYTAPATEK